MTHGADDRDDDGRQVGEVPVSRPERDAGDGDVADAVAHQGEPALHEVGADGRGGQPGEQRRRAAPGRMKS